MENINKQVIGILADDWNKQRPKSECMEAKDVTDIKSLKVYANIEKLDDPTLEIDKDGNVKVTVARFSIGGAK